MNVDLNYEFPGAIFNFSNSRLCRGAPPHISITAEISEDAAVADARLVRAVSFWAAVIAISRGLHPTPTDV